jgi:uncharacterized protein YjbI with pentapeptide repeats
MRIIAPMMILIMLTATLAGCSGDDDSGLSKEELVQQIRNGDHYGTDFTGVDLSDSDLSGLDNMELFGLDFSGADLSLVDFTGSDLGYVDFTDAILSHALFSNNNLEGAIFAGYYSSLTIRDSNLKSTLWDGELDWVRFENVDLSWAEFGGRLSEYAITLDSVWFTDSTFYGTKFHCFKNEGDVRFYRNSISYMSLTQEYIDCGIPDWSDTHFQENTFSDTNLEWGNFDDAYFFCNTFIYSDLSNNDFTTTVFRSSWYDTNEVCPQTFTNTWLEYSTFSSTGGLGTSFSGSNLQFAEFSATYGINEDITWNDTICPDGTNSDDNENTCENNL